MSREAKFWDKRAEKYSQRPVANQAAYEEKLKIMRAYLTPDSEVLEIGCGTGSTALALSPNAKHILATDISSEMIRIAWDKAGAAKIENVSFEVRAVDDHDIAEAQYDVIMAHNLLHLLADEEAVIEAAYRGLKPGGVFVTSTACVGDMTWVFKVIASVGYSLRLIPLVKVFTQAELVQNFVGAGFGIVQEWLPKNNAAVFIVARKP